MVDVRVPARHGGAALGGADWGGGGWEDFGLPGVAQDEVAALVGGGGQMMRAPNMPGIFFGAGAGVSVSV